MSRPVLTTNFVQMKTLVSRHVIQVTVRVSFVTHQGNPVWIVGQMQMSFARSIVDVMKM